MSVLDFELAKDWMDITPQIPAQYFVHCYGIVKIKEDLYMISDLIQDNTFLPSQKADFQRKKTLDILKRKMDVRSSIDEESSQSANNEISSNVYDIIKSLGIGNLSAMSKIPSFLIRFLLKYII